VQLELLNSGSSCCVLWLTNVNCKAGDNGIATGSVKSSYLCIKAKVADMNTECSNYRGILLLSVPDKVHSHVILARMKSHLQQLGGFTAHRSTTDCTATHDGLADKAKHSTNILDCICRFPGNHCGCCSVRMVSYQRSLSF